MTQAHAGSRLRRVCGSRLAAFARNARRARCVISRGTYVTQLAKDGLLLGLVRLCTLVSFMAVWAPAARACSIPVFRYALERWAADNYEVFAFHRGPLSPDQQDLIDWLEARDADGGGPANFTLRRVDLAAATDASPQLVREAESAKELPWITVHYPSSAGIEGSVWAGPLTAASARALVNSPMRGELARRLLAGDSAVWVLLACGSREKDAAAAKLLEAELPRAAAAAEPPVQAEPEPSFRPSFSLLRLSGSDPAERVLINMLRHSEADLKAFSEPIAFPIFGRGRILYALVGRGINPENILQACAFLTGPCSCQVKALNPGTDLLMSADWGIYPEEDTAEIEYIELPSLAAAVPEAASGVAAKPAARSGPVTASPGAWSPRLLRNILLGGLPALGILACGAYVAKRRHRPRRANLERR